MRTIYKHPLSLLDSQVIKTYQAATPVHVAMQYGQPTLWISVETDNPVCERVVYIVGTGHDLRNIPANVKYVGTFQTHDGDLVLHVYA